MKKEFAFKAFLFFMILSLAFSFYSWFIPGQNIQNINTSEAFFIWYWSSIKILDLQVFALYSWVAAVIIFFINRRYFFFLLGI